MKKLIIVLMAIAMVASVYGLSFANGLGNGIAGSPHDFSARTWNARAEICRVCHVPHDHGLTTQYYLNGLLWNHAVSTATYTMYDQTWSSTLDNTVSAQPVGTAKLCLACHDGTVAVDTFDKYAGGDFTILPAGDKVPGFDNGTSKDLRGTHPISIVYNDVVDPNLKSAATTAMGLSGMIADVLDQGRVQCSTCHDVHDQESVPNTHLLRVAQTVATGGTASGLCLTCHIK